MKGFGDNKQLKTNNLSVGNVLVNNKFLDKAIEFQAKGQILEASKCYKHLINQGLKNAQVFSNYGTCLKEIGKFIEAESYYRKAIQINPKYAMAYSNLGATLLDLGKLKDAKIFILKAIELNPKYAMAYFNLGCIQLNLGKLKDAETSFCKTIELNPDFVQPYFSLSILKCQTDNKNWYKTLLSKKFLIKKNAKEKVDIYFARANILHKEKKYHDASINLQLANNLKLKFKKSDLDYIIKKSSFLLAETYKTDKNFSKISVNDSENIFIVGMPRSGSTLVESILSINDNVIDLGEKNIFEEAFFESKKVNHNITLKEIYSKKINYISKRYPINTNKALFNFQYAGIIAKQLPNSKIIHCERNPLDNILSIYRAHFNKGNHYSSSLNDCAKLYLNQKEIMDTYKNLFPENIYCLNYESLVKSPTKIIKSLINWLGWKWDDRYLSPQLNNRPVFTRSLVEVRSPINSKSIGTWKNYEKMLKPAIKIIQAN